MRLKHAQQTETTEEGISVEITVNQVTQGLKNFNLSLVSGYCCYSKLMEGVYDAAQHPSFTQTLFLYISECLAIISKDLRELILF